MRASDFHSILGGDKADGIDRLALLNTVVDKYPYFSAAQVLLAKEMWDTDHINKQEQLQEAAIRVVDRTQLYNLIHGEVEEGKPIVSSEPEATDVSESQIEEEQIEEIVQEQTDTTGIPDELIPDIAVYDVTMAESMSEETSEQEVSETEPVQEDSEHSFVEWLGLMDEESVAEPMKKKRSKTELIDQFLANEPQIEQVSHPKFYSPQEMGRKSLEDDFEFVSETLAKIYEDQGDTEKAIKAYESLMAKYPEKSSIFAARLKNLREQSK